MTEQELPLTPRHLKLSKWTTVSAVASSVYEMYGDLIDPRIYEDRLAFVADDGLLTLEVVEISTGKTIWVFKDRYTITRQLGQNTTLDNPKAFPYQEVVNNFGITINTEKELMFLKDLPLNVYYDSSQFNADKSRKLADLLNRYGVGDGWSANPNGGNTTAYFMMRYFGPGSKAPDIYNFNRDTSLLVVVELATYGGYKTHALFVG